MNLIPDHELERSSVVANCCMNRERSLTGSNGYSKELGFNPLNYLKERATVQGHACWLDLCCGSGKALIEAAQIIVGDGLNYKIQIVGVDLIANDVQPGLRGLSFVQASLSTWEPEQQFDLITCVHGLHYIGDKLGLISRAASWLTNSGRFFANLDLENLQIENCLRSSRIVGKELRLAGLVYNSRKKILSCEGQKEINFPFQYLGADDQAGPNWTGQPAVNSYYQ